MIEHDWTWLKMIDQIGKAWYCFSTNSDLVYHKVIFRLLMKEKFDINKLWPFWEKLIFTIVAQSTVRHSTVDENQESLWKQ